MKEMMDFSGKHILILGLGESGLAMAQWLSRCGARLRVADTRENPQRLSELQQLTTEWTFVAGPFTPDLLADIDLIAVSPGLSPKTDLAEIIAAIGPNAQLAGQPAVPADAGTSAHQHSSGKTIPLWGEVEFFAHALAGLKQTQEYQPKVIAITGTNGKTTVTSLTGLLCRRAGQSVKVAGNISPSMLTVLMEAIASESLPQVWVLELSSFQLHTSYSLQADAATVLNISEDHLDWHGDLKSYAADKARIFGQQTVRVLNREDALVMSFAPHMTPAPANSVKKNTPAAAIEPQVITFGTNPPVSAFDLGLQTENGIQWLVAADMPEVVAQSRRKKADNFLPELQISRLMPSEALKIRGLHNAANALAALALCRAIGLNFAPLLHALRDYQGEPHRVESVASIGGVDYVDDSKGTNVGATVAALQGLGRELMTTQAQPRIILIAGGEGKGQNFAPLQPAVTAYVKAVFLIGKDAAQLKLALQNCAVPLHDARTLELAVKAAADLAVAGDVVLLSPACASLDMFRNYAHRAEVFVAAVRELALDRGEIC